MLHFLGILEPGLQKRIAGDEAPLKKALFGGVDEIEQTPDDDGSAYTKAERDEAFLTGKHFEGVETVVALREEMRFAALFAPPYY